MATLLTGFSILAAEAMAKAYQRIHALNFGVYGASKAGKTTLPWEKQVYDITKKYAK